MDVHKTYAAERSVVFGAIKVRMVEVDRDSPRSFLVIRAVIADHPPRSREVVPVEVEQKSLEVWPRPLAASYKTARKHVRPPKEMFSVNSMAILDASRRSPRRI